MRMAGVRPRLVRPLGQGSGMKLARLAGALRLILDILATAVLAFILIVSIVAASMIVFHEVMK